MFCGLGFVPLRRSPFAIAYEIDGLRSDLLMTFSQCCRGNCGHFGISAIRLTRTPAFSLFGLHTAIAACDAATTVIRQLLASTRTTVSTEKHACSLPAAVVAHSRVILLLLLLLYASCMNNPFYEVRSYHRPHQAFAKD